MTCSKPALSFSTWFTIMRATLTAEKPETKDKPIEKLSAQLEYVGLFTSLAPTVLGNEYSNGSVFIAFNERQIGEEKAFNDRKMRGRQNDGWRTLR
jgi:hypothetical protein